MINYDGNEAQWTGTYHTPHMIQVLEEITTPASAGNRCTYCDKLIGEGRFYWLVDGTTVMCTACSYDHR